MTRATPMKAYDEILASRREAMSGAQARTQAGDPGRAAQALLKVLDSPTPPRRLLLRRMTVQARP